MSCIYLKYKSYIKIILFLFASLGYRDLEKLTILRHFSSLECKLDIKSHYFLKKIGLWPELTLFLELEIYTDCYNGHKMKNTSGIVISD